MRVDRARFHRWLGDLHAGQVAAEQLIRQRRRVVLRCGRRFGKTNLLARELLWCVLRGGRVWWVAPTHALCRTGFAYVEKMVSGLPTAIRHRVRLWRSPPYRLRYGDGEAEFYSTRDPDSLQGAGNDLVIFDEAATEQAGDWIVEQFLSPTLLDRKGRLVIASTPKGRNWFAEYCQRPDFTEFHATTYDNPLIDREEIDQLREQLPERVFRQEILAEIVEDAGRFWDLQPAPSEEPVGTHADICGIDWGYASPFAAVWLRRVGQQFHVVHEEYAAGLDADAQAKRVLAGPRASRYVCDPSTPEGVRRAWHEAGLNAVAPGSRDREGGWARIRVWIRDGTLRVSPRCFNLLREFMSVEVSPRNPHDLIGDDHALDALRYAVSDLAVVRGGQTEPADPLARFIQRSLRRSMRRG